MVNNLVLLGTGGLIFYMFMKNQSPQNYVVNTNNVSEAKSELYRRPYNEENIQVNQRPQENDPSVQLYQPQIKIGPVDDYVKPINFNDKH
jgi:hypothetical protein